MTDFCRKHWFYIVCAGLIILQLLFSLRFMGRQYFSLDEVSQIGFIAKKNTWGGIIDYYLTSEVTNLPLWPLLAALWYRIVPYGEGWMRLLTVLLTTAFIILSIKLAKEYGNERTGVIMALLMCISPVVMQKCGLTFRVHAFWMVFTSFTMWRYVRRLKSMGNESIKDILILGIAMAGLAWSHYFGCLTIIYLFLTDCVLFLRKKLRGSFIISYVMAGGSLLPWFILMLIRHTMKLDDFWPKTPTFESIPKALKYITGHDEIIFILLILSMIVAFLLLTDSIMNGLRKFDERFIRFAFAFMPLFFIVADYIYSAHINVRSGIFVLRYFLSVLPAALLSVAVLTDEVTDRLSKKLEIPAFLSYGSLILLILFLVGCPNYYHDVKDEISAPFDNTYGNVRDYVESRGGIRDEKAVLAINANRANADGFEEYYMERGGTQADVHVISNDDTDIGERFENADTVYIYQVMQGTPDIFTDLMGNDFTQEEHDEDVGLYVFSKK